MLQQRSTLGALFDYATSRFIGLPPETCTYTTKNVQIPIQSDAGPFELVAELYQPVFADGTRPAGTILVRCPYGRGFMFTFNNARCFASRGYQVPFVSCRGTFGSGGSFDPWAHEERDGHAVVAWMRSQPWYTGSFATLGSSYLGFVQWALLRDPPVDMVAAVIPVAPHNFGEQLWSTGAFSLDWVLWAENVAHQEETGVVSLWRRLNIPKKLAPLFNSTPLEPAIATHFKNSAPWLERFLNHSDPADRFYESLRFDQALHKADLPTLLVGGWYDIFLRQTVDQYTQLCERGCNVALTLGPWSHLDVGVDGRTPRQTLEWLEVHLAKRRSDQRKAPVQYYMTGAQDWRDIPRWPPVTTPYLLYLHENKVLAECIPCNSSGSSTFTFNPQDPTPAMGGNMLATGGSVDDTILASRSDVLVFTTEPMESDMDVVGRILVELKHSSDSPSSDLFIRISEVDGRGRSRNVTETYRRLNGMGKDEPVILTLNDCAHRFMKGRRIRLLISGSWYPQYTMNVNNALASTKHIIHHNSQGSSKIFLPVYT